MVVRFLLIRNLVRLDGLAIQSFVFLLVRHGFTYAIAALQSVAGRRSQDDGSCDLRLATCE